MVGAAQSVILWSSVWCQCVPPAVNTNVCTSSMIVQCARMFLNVHQCVWMCTNLCLNVHQCDPSRVQGWTQRQGPEDRFSQNAAAGCLINSAQHTIVKHTNFCFVRTKCFPLWKVNTTIPANRHHRIFCKANEWCFYSSLVSLVVEWYFMTEYVGLCCAPNSIWDNQLLLKEAIAFFSEGVRAWAWEAMVSTDVGNPMKEREREMEWRGMGTHLWFTFITAGGPVTPRLLPISNKTISDGGITVDFRFIKVYTSNWSSNSWGSSNTWGSSNIWGSSNTWDHRIVWT